MKGQYTPKSQRLWRNRYLLGAKKSYQVNNCMNCDQMYIIFISIDHIYTLFSSPSFQSRQRSDIFTGAVTSDTSDTSSNGNPSQGIRILQQHLLEFGREEGWRKQETRDRERGEKGRILRLPFPHPPPPHHPNLGSLTQFIIDPFCPPSPPLTPTGRGR